MVAQRRASPPRVMRRKRLGVVVLGISCALVFGTYLAWSFGTQSEAKAQYNANLKAAATGQPPRQIDPNRRPAYMVGLASIGSLSIGLLLAKPRRTPITELPSSFFGQTTQGETTDDR